MGWCQRMVGNRELPPRFQRKQQQQLKDAHFAGESSPSDTATSGYGIVIPSSCGTGSTSVPMHGMLFQQPPGTYAPMMPPMMMGTAMMAGNPGGGSPVMAGKSPAPAGTEDVSLRPVRNFAPLLKPNTPAMLPRSAQSSSTTRTQVCIIGIRDGFLAVDNFSSDDVSRIIHYFCTALD